MRLLPALVTALLVAGQGSAAAPPAGGPAADPGSPAVDWPAWSWPLEPRPPVLAPFAAPPGRYAAGHRGVDLAAAVGQPVRAVGAGVVAFAGQVAGRGVVSVDHPGGLRTTYEPVAATVRAGTRVGRGTVLGTVTAAPGHCLPGTCLHWGLRRGEAYLDPMGLVTGWAGVRLLPVRAVTAGRAGPRRAGRSRRGRCRPGPRAGGSRGPPRW